MRKLLLFSLLALLFVSIGCNSTKPIVISITSPAGAQALDIGQSFNISVTVSDKTNKGATITLTGVGSLTNVTSTGATYTATVSGTATITITSVADPTKMTTIKIVVTAAPSITSPAALPAATQGTAYNVTLTETGGAGTLNFTVLSGSLPAGLNLSSSGTISGTATGPNGTVTFTVKVTDSSTVSPQSSTETFTIIVNQAPSITSANSAAFTAGAAGSFTVTSTGSPTPALAETGALPAGVTFVDNGNGTGTLSGSSAVTASYPITFTASNGVAPNATQSFTLTIGQAPAITSAMSTTFTVGTAGTFMVTTSGFPAPALTETGALPGGVTFLDNKNGTATLAGTPAAGTGKAYSFSITAQNGIAPNAMQTFTLTVDQAPAITSTGSATFTVSTAGTFMVTTTGFPTPSLTKTGTLPTGVTLTDNGNGTATLAGTPAAGTAGAYPIMITASNGVAPNGTQSFTLTIGQAPAITSAASTTFTVGTAGSFTVTTTGFPTPSLSESGTLPTGVTLVDNGNGTATLAGTPAPGTGKAYPFTITAQNEIAPNATQSFTLTVDQAPAITSGASTTFSVGGAGTFAVTTTGFPTPSLSEMGALPSGVTFVNNGNGTATLAGTPAAGTAGTYPITITASNGVGSNATQNFTLTVDTAPVITSASKATFTVGSAGTFTVTTTGTPTPSITGTGALPSGVSFTDNGNGTATLAGTPAVGTGGTYSLNIKAQNGLGNGATQTFTLTVDQAPAITSASSATFTIGQSGSFTVTASGFPIAALSETGALPSGVTFVDNGNNTATLSGIPAPGSNSSYAITITGNNGVSPNGTQVFTLNLNAPAAIVIMPATGALPSGTLGQSYGPVTISATGGIQPYTFAIDASGTQLPSPLTLTNSNPGQGNNTGVISGTPSAGATLTGIIVDVTDSNVPPTVQKVTYSLTINAAACGSGSESLLSAGYAFVLKGIDNTGNPAIVGGVLTFNGTDGDGLITAGTIDVNVNAGVQTLLNVTSGTYSVGSNQRGCMTITSSLGTYTYRFSLGNITSGVAATAHVIDFDTTGPFVTGTMRKQTGGPFSTSQVTGTYAFGGSSAQNITFTSGGVAGGKFGYVGVLDFNGGGGITSGSEDINQNGVLDGDSSLTAWPATSPITFNSATSSYTIASNGRGTLTIGIVGVATSSHSVLYAVSPTDALFMSSDPQTTNNISAGEAIQQTGAPFSANPLSGTYIGYDSGLGSTFLSTTRTDIILLGPLTSGDANLSGTQIKNHNGAISTGSITGTYSTSPAGRMIVAGGGPALYLANTGAAFFLNNNVSVDTGFFESQSAASFSNTSVSGTYAFGTVDPEDPNVTDEDGVATFTSPTINGTSDDNGFGSQSPNNVFLPQSYSVDLTGLGVSPAECTPGGTGGAGCQLAFYIISPNKAVVIQLENSSITEVKAISAIEIADK